ncbi:acyl-CoA N-acyltransferase [Astrocystis sublimbata]|nr:acyl-CoA N-acyltransferase [Astrocystis sublimbata]
MPSIVIKEIDQEKDLSALAEINRRTFLQELPSQIAYKPSEDTGNQLHGFFVDRLAGRFSQPGARTVKAVDQDTNQIYGFACYRHVVKDSEPVGPIPGSPDTRGAKPKALPSLPPYMNAEFTVATGAEVKALEVHMEGEYYYLTSFAVHPDHQNQGIGAQILQHFLKAADEAKLPCWLIGFPGSHSLYLRNGFVDKGHVDNDLNAWDNNRCRGFGVYRAFAMVRQPQATS